jgi:hypothetical protein
MRFFIQETSGTSTIAGKFMKDQNLFKWKCNEQFF